MKLITEDILDTQFIVEVDKSTGTKKHHIVGVFMQAELQNRNGRVYPKKVLEQALSKFQPLIEQKRSVGEFPHPSGPSINPDRVSHIITELQFNGNDVYGKARIMDTPMGKIAKTFLDEGVKLGVSSRGMGSIVKANKGYDIVQEDYHLNTVDIVHEPSGIDCWVNGIMEGADWIYEATSDSWRLAEQIKKDFNKKTAKQLAEVQASYFQNFLKSIK